MTFNNLEGYIFYHLKFLGWTCVFGQQMIHQVRTETRQSLGLIARCQQQTIVAHNDNFVDDDASGLL